MKKKKRSSIESFLNDYQVSELPKINFLCFVFSENVCHIYMNGFITILKFFSEMTNLELLGISEAYRPNAEYSIFTKAGEYSWSVLIWIWISINNYLIIFDTVIIYWYRIKCLVKKLSRVHLCHMSMKVNQHLTPHTTYRIRTTNNGHTSNSYLTKPGFQNQNIRLQSK